ncbi:MAG: hypothetical protein U5Q44_14880 [Dehalococcoidia bacterium]|nr:hypothetical protein [Dehalococcoidia bacterium]
MVFSRGDGTWRMNKSAYRKLRLSGPAVVELLEQQGFVDVAASIDAMTFLTARKPVAS